MTYVIVAVLATICTFLGFALECTSGNITHLENGREPNAGAALFPNIPFNPLLAVGVAWALERVHVHLGLWVFVGLFLIYLPCWWFSLRRLTRKLDALKADTGYPSEDPTQAD